MDVSDIMTRTLVTASHTDSVRTALRLLEDQEIRHLPVVEDDRLIGMVSDRDLREYRLPLMEEAEEPEYADDLLETPITEVMNSNVITMDTSESLVTAVDLMIEYGVGAVPVVDQHTEELVGIVSYVDLLKAIRPSLEE